MDWITGANVTGSVLSVLLALRLAASPTENRVGAWMLAGFLVCAAFTILDSTFYRQGWFALVPAFYGVANPFIAASGALFYLYACAATDPAFRWRWTRWLHFIPSAVFLFGQIPLLFLPVEEKLRLAQQDLVPAGTLGERLASTGVFDLYLLTYFVLAWWRFWRCRERIIESREEGRSHPLRGIGAFATVLVLLNLVSAVLDFTPWMLTGMTILGLAGVIAVFAAFWFVSNPIPLVEPRAHRLLAEPISPPAAPSVTTLELSATGDAASTASVAVIEAPVASLPDEETKRLAAKLTRVMDAEKPYLDAGLSLHSLAQKLGTTRHRTSDAIKCAYGATFYQVVAGHRAREAARVLASKEGQARTIADIAFAAGFNTLSAFNMAFRAEFAMTPKAYRESARRPEDGRVSDGSAR